MSRIKIKKETIIAMNKKIIMMNSLKMILIIYNFKNFKVIRNKKVLGRF